MKMKTIKEIYKESLTENVPLFPEYNGDWWTGIYTQETQSDIDKLFLRYYTNYEFFSSISDLYDSYTDENALIDFKEAIYSLFIKNDKKYTELYRIHVIPDNEAYALTNNYDIHEIYNGTVSSNGATITGQRTDVSYDNMGNQNTSGINKVTAFNSSSENTNNSNEQAFGSKQDTHQFTKGQETDTNRMAGTDSHNSRRYGNLGVMTVDDILTKHQNFWLVWDFLQVIFNDICKDYLLIGR